MLFSEKNIANIKKLKKLIYSIFENKRKSEVFIIIINFAQGKTSLINLLI